MSLARKKALHLRMREALALLHNPPVLTDAERARIEHELAQPRQEKQPKLPLEESRR